MYAVVSAQSPRELGSDRAILSQPSLDLVMCLLDPRLYSSADTSLMARLATALAACSQLSVLTAAQRMWSLQKLHRLLVPSNTVGDVAGNTALSEILQSKSSDSALASLLEELPQALLRQYEYEDLSVRAGIHLMYSDFFKVSHRFRLHMSKFKEKTSCSYSNSHRVTRRFIQYTTINITRLESISSTYFS